MIFFFLFVGLVGLLECFSPCSFFIETLQSVKADLCQFDPGLQAHPSKLTNKVRNGQQHSSVRLKQLFNNGLTDWHQGPNTNAFPHFDFPFFVQPNLNLKPSLQLLLYRPVVKGGLVMIKRAVCVCVCVWFGGGIQGTRDDFSRDSHVKESIQETGGGVGWEGCGGRGGRGAEGEWSRVCVCVFVSVVRDVQIHR